MKRLAGNSKKEEALGTENAEPRRGKKRAVQKKREERNLSHYIDRKSVV